jgi:hypothetical protein
MTPMDIILIASPLILIQFALAVFCILDILKKGVRNLNPTIWIIISLVNLVGAIAYLLFGRKGEGND